MAEYITTDAELTAIANAIRSRGGTSAPLEYPDDFVRAIEDLASITVTDTPDGNGGTIREINTSGLVHHVTDGDADVIFYDYDGSYVHTYSKAQFLALTEMPQNPSHAGLTAQGWNWTLADAKTYVQKYGILDIGQLYVTDDGKTRLYISLTEPERMTLNINFHQAAANAVEVNWGDGSATETSAGSSHVSLSHTYESVGNYIITLYSSASSYEFGHTSSVKFFSGSGFSYFSQALKKIELGKNATVIRSSAFAYCINLESITVTTSFIEACNYAFQYCTNLKHFTYAPNTPWNYSYIFEYATSLKSISFSPAVTSINSSMFSNCYSLRRVCFPQGMQQIPSYCLAQAVTLEKVVIPDSVTSMDYAAFINAQKLKELIIPSGVTILGANMASGCYSLKKVTFLNKLTSLANTQIFYTCYSLTSIELPENLTSIGSSVFHSCRSLVKITIPSTVTSIGASAFNANGSLKEVHMLPETPPTAGSNMFAGYDSNFTIYVPYSADHSILAAYQSATNWSNFASVMVEEPAP